MRLRARSSQHVVLSLHAHMSLLNCGCHRAVYSSISPGGMQTLAHVYAKHT